MPEPIENIELSPDNRKALERFAKLIMQYNFHYPKAQIMQKISKKVNGDAERTRKAFYYLIKSKIIRNAPGGKVVMPGI